MWSFSRNLPFVDPVPGISRPGPATVFPIWPSSGCWRTCRPSRRGNTRGYPRVSWSTFIQCECGKSPFKIRKSPIAGPFSNIFHSYVGLLESIHIYIHTTPSAWDNPLGKKFDPTFGHGSASSKFCCHPIHSDNAKSQGFQWLSHSHF